MKGWSLSAPSPFETQRGGEGGTPSRIAEEQRLIDKEGLKLTLKARRVFMALEEGNMTTKVR
jgi:hypothetical protein